MRPERPHRVPGEPPAASSIRTAVGAATRNLISPLMNCSASRTWCHCQSLGGRKPGLLTAAPGANQTRGIALRSRHGRREREAVCRPYPGHEARPQAAQPGPLQSRQALSEPADGRMEGSRKHPPEPGP